MSDRSRDVLRGYDLDELIARAHYADLAFLLIHGALPGRGKQAMFANALGDGARMPDEVRDVLTSGPPEPLAAVRVALAALPEIEPAEYRGRVSRGANVTRGVRIMALAPTIVAGAHRARGGHPRTEPEHDLSYPARFLQMIPGAPVDQTSVVSLDRVLRTLADRPTGTAVATVRAEAASEEPDLYRALAAASRSEEFGPASGIDPGAPGASASSSLRALGIADELHGPIAFCARIPSLVAHYLDERGLSAPDPGGEAPDEDAGELHLPEGFAPSPL